MVGEVCAFYGWTVDHVLQMQASRFFLMLEALRKLRAQELQRACYVSRAAQMTPQAFREVVEFFGSTWNTEPKELPEKPENAPIIQPPLVGDAARDAVMAVFAKDTRINRMQTANKPPKHPGNMRG